MQLMNPTPTQPQCLGCERNFSNWSSLWAVENRYQRMLIESENLITDTRLRLILSFTANQRLKTRNKFSVVTAKPLLFGMTGFSKPFRLSS